MPPPTIYVDSRNDVIQSFIDGLQLEIDRAEALTRKVLEKWLNELASKSVGGTFSGYQVKAQYTNKKITVGKRQYQFRFWRLKFLPPGGEGAWNIINTLDTGRKKLPARSEPYVLFNSGVVQEVDRRGWRQIQRQPAITSANTSNLQNAGETVPKLFSMGPIRRVEPRNFYPELLKLCNNSLKANNIDTVTLEIIRER